MTNGLSKESIRPMLYQCREFRSQISPAGGVEGELDDEEVCVKDSSEQARAAEGVLWTRKE